MVDAKLRFQRHVEEIIENRDEEDVEKIKAVVQKAVEKILLGKKFDGTISGAVEASIKEANKRINAILAQEELEEEQEDADEPAGIEQKSSSFAGAAAEGFKFIGSFFAQAAMGGAELPDLMREEEQAYNSQAIVLPLRRLAASASTEAEHDALVGGPGINVPTPAAPSLEASQQHAKEGREAQQNALKEQTGDTLYPSSGREEPINNGATETANSDERSAKIPRVDQGVPSQAEQLSHLREPRVPGGLQEEDWNVPGRGGTAKTASEAKASDVKGSIGHGDAL
ncbi:hypothetical protein COCSUDRAFT_56760 [Coccomyxa subellipsoidea C-169]|uniref:Uncharacterized protein n=1 Tax=Coccomyxa subellipsoidea (strain C-169) TaxID=574566 RepID=I0YT28_COCSC|nr:hypothetical protein COCSUDRAFT_56760 [Coccomyxa subellipsoidea C-169]EIE21547.1 hypothetical protein COCSUDRAFT_56760 [Coccomyxa subellipsoidea C-169]|eukprot:XP_005646091.1 hypothetical protein COCSUDRAFT_56760 [Coccomyxa subellipsoidea C-169]